MKNKNSVHPLQSFEWGEFRKRTGVKVVRAENFQLTIHPIPYTLWSIGYLPKGPLPTKKMIEQLLEIGKKENCIFIQIEPNIEVESGKLKMENLILNSQFSRRRHSLWRRTAILNSPHPLFTKYTFQIDLTKSEKDLLASMHPKTRYNIKVAQKHGVKVVEDNSDKAFKIYLQLLKETIKRQKFYAHDEKYHRLMWQILKPARIAHLLIAYYSLKPLARKGASSAYPLNPISLVAWILFVYNGVLYYPYGASTDKYKEVMASNLLMWEAIRFGKKLGLKTFDLWGCLGPSPDKNDPWYGFHRFKLGYGGKLAEFVGSYDLVINPILYKLYIFANNLRWLILHLIKK